MGGRRLEQIMRRGEIGVKHGPARPRIYIVADRENGLSAALIERIGWLLSDTARCASPKPKLHSDFESPLRFNDGNSWLAANTTSRNAQGPWASREAIPNRRSRRVAPRLGNIWKVGRWS